MRPSASRIQRLHTSAEFVEIAKTPSGRLILVAIFSVLAYIQGLPAVALGLALAVLSLWPSRRRILVAGATAYWLLAYGRVGNNWIALLIVGLGAWSVLSLFHQQPEHWIFQRPVRNLLALYIALLATASYLPWAPFAKALLWAVLAAGGKYLWFMGYALMDRKGVSRQRPLVAFLRFQPFWGGSNVPFPKGEANLDHIEARSAEQLAVCQLRGIELMVWSTILIGAVALLDHTLRKSWGHMSELNVAIALYLKGTPLPRLDCWLAVVGNFTRKLLWISGWGGTVIATCRMAGFSAVRNTRRPLASRTIAEFYNRLYYYFKELLVTFFFYPTYFRYFKKHPRLRVFAATVAAAGFGNALFHFLRDIDFIVQEGLWRALVDFHVYAIYTLILGVAIAVSQLRALNGNSRGGRYTGPLGVLAFYCLVMVLDDPHRGWNARDYFSFLINLFTPFPR